MYDANCVISGTQLNLSEIATNIEERAEGYWQARSISRISYPDYGNEACFAVEDTSFWFRHRNNCILQILQSYPPSGTFFDIGGGNGFVAHAVEKLGIDVVLVEPGPAGARNARKRGVRRVLEGTLDDAGFLPGTVPAAGLFDVIEHIQDDGQFLCKLHMLLRPNGRVYITVPAFQALWSHEDIEAGHWRRYTKGALCRVLRSCGFQMEFCSYIFGFLPPAIFLLRVLPFRLGLQHKAHINSTRAQHELQNGMLNRLISILSRRELSMLARGRQRVLGGSCLAVARKIAR